jgi:hypothetical protein
MSRPACAGPDDSKKQIKKLAEEPVWSETVSGANSLFCRENTGNFADLGQISLDATSQTPAIVRSPHANSLHAVTGNFQRGTGKIQGITANSVRLLGQSSPGVKPNEHCHGSEVEREARVG